MILMMVVVVMFGAHRLLKLGNMIFLAAANLRWSPSSLQTERTEIEPNQFSKHILKYFSISRSHSSKGKYSLVRKKEM